MKYRAARPAYITRSQVEAGPHYAEHVDKPGERHEMRHLSDTEMDGLVRPNDEAETLRGVPQFVNYKHGVIRVWPWPAAGWQVWSGLTKREIAT